MMNIRNPSWLFTAKINAPVLEKTLAKKSIQGQYLYRRDLEDILFLFEESLLIGELHPDLANPVTMTDKDRTSLQEHQFQFRRLLDYCPDDDQFHIYRPANNKGRNSSYPSKLP